MRIEILLFKSCAMTLTLSALVVGCTIPVPNPGHEAVAEVVNNTGDEVTVGLQRTGNGNPIRGTKKLGANTGKNGSNNTFLLRSDNLASGECVTPIFTPASTPNGVFYAPDSTWCIDSDGKVERWLIEMKPNPPSPLRPASTDPGSTTLG